MNRYKENRLVLCVLQIYLNSKKTSSRSFKEFLGNKNKINKKRFLEEATGHNDHYMINMGGQRPKIGGNRTLTGPYLQR